MPEARRRTRRAGSRAKSSISEYRQAERLDRLKTRLLSGRRVTVAKIEEEFGVSIRTARRDLKKLELMGVDLEHEDLDTGERSWLVPERARHIRVRYSILDVMSLFFGRRMFDFLENTLLADSLDNVYRDIEAQLKNTADLNNAKQLKRKVYLVHEGPKKLPSDAIEVLDSCLTGLLREQKLRAEYTGLSGEPKAHVLHPYTLAAYKRGLYLVAYTERAKACTTFSLERFNQVEWLRGESFKYPKKYQPETFFRSALFITPGEPEKLELIFSKTTEPFIRIRKFHETQQIKKLADGRISMTLEAPVNFETVNWVMSFGAHVEVVKPKRLREQVMAELRRALGVYGA